MRQRDSLHTGYCRHARVLTERFRQITLSIPTSRVNETRWGVLARFIEREREKEGERKEICAADLDYSGYECLVEGQARI